jgi:hypothetical protein
VGRKVGTPCLDSSTRGLGRIGEDRSSCLVCSKPISFSSGEYARFLLWMLRLLGSLTRPDPSGDNNECIFMRPAFTFGFLGPRGVRDGVCIGAH